MLNRTFVIRELVCRVLGVLCKLEADMAGNGTLRRLERAGDKVEKSRFACAVLTHNRYTGLHAGNKVRVNHWF